MSEAAPFFNSRWIEAPDYVTEVPGGGLPRGFRAAGVACGIKPSGAKDLALMVCDEPATTSAAKFTTSGAASAPVLLNRERADLAALRADRRQLGQRQRRDGRAGARRCGQDAGRCGAGLWRRARPRSPSPRPGVIGVPLPMDVITRGIAAASRELRPDGELDFAQAIRTTDVLAKQ